MQSFIVSAKRTPFGAFGGKLKAMSATDLAAIASNGAIADLPTKFQEAARDPESKASVFSSSIFGNVLQTSNDACYLPRHAALKAGLPIQVPALGVNRLCGSGFQAIVNAVQEIKAGDSEISLVGGSESMSQAPFVIRDARWGMKFGPENHNLEDSLVSALTDRYPTHVPMGITAENLAKMYNITREMSDEYSVQSQIRWKLANDEHVFDREIVPIELKSRKGPEMFATDEHPRPTSTVQVLSKLKPVFLKDGVVTAASASGICDGAAALVVASESACNKHNLTPMSRIVSYHVVGVEPSIMGIGPADAIRGALLKANKTLDEMDIIEINEAFSAQVLAVSKEIDVDMHKTNVCGGAISIGHPLGASGARIMTHLAHRLIATKKRWAIGSACIGGGQGIAIVIENMQL
ncbi:3-ketoacyl-CoA thiolase, mitochondrial [Smittium mucronatum]|uniref:3-ketoacyl-CoA thiolase, mitochondrial n=1 Tax=Smittium mucronatum TaxID=133383 RepID=A0A1R0GWB9_9FUNG|nr:3-ketoacyl-CoA thiolase, mitochondrial [Smittium mucronatum]